MSETLSQSRPPELEAKSDALELESFLPYRLTLLSHLVSQGISAAYQGEFNLSQAQWRVMAAVAAHPGITAQRVVDMTPMDKVAVSRAVAALAGRGLLERSASPRDGRVALLSLTEAGWGIYQQIAPRAAAFSDALQSFLTPAERSQLLTLTGRLVQRAAELVNPKRALAPADPGRAVDGYPEV